MDKPTPKDRIAHIQSAIILIQSFVKDQTEKDFIKDKKGHNAVLYQFLVIGEAIRHIDNNILVKYKYPWHIPKSFRNFIAHEYHKLKLESVYRAAKDLDNLLKQITDILRNEY